ncbi:hypothetical protein [Amycolatopsis sp. TNS106]|uniref:hypothetical protein n=1 Tax=Amycolatopsis sp. TNS106 TaxID=2861750 RepID=UPI001C563575|nr:hypothetical protein [Amycolatopsis sp. TNS106]QXV63567.1 hypothetical protein CVV72_41135 [Amycolatopsis sp. TNS106]
MPTTATPATTEATTTLPTNNTADPKPKAPKRINVAVNPETVQALQHVIDKEGVTLTEAVRRLIGYGEVLYRAVKDDGAEVSLKTENETKKVIIL